MRKSYYALVLVFCIVLLLTNSSAYAQDAAWAWVRKAETIQGDAFSKGIGTDAAGNVYVVGQSFGLVDFALPNYPPVPFGMFLAKYNKEGDVLWVTSCRAYPKAMVTDAAGNTYVTGSFRDTLTLGSFSFVNDVYGYGDIFVAKFNSNGKVVWAKRAQAARAVEGKSIAVDAAGNCYVGILLENSPDNYATFDHLSLQFPPESANYFSLLAKYNANGQIQWVRQIGNGGQDLLRGLAVNNQGDCLMIGLFSDTLHIGNTSFISKGYTDVCYAKYSASGNLIWAKSFGGPGDDFGEAIAANKWGEIFLSGCHFDSFQLNSFPATSNRGLYHIKCDSNGNPLWLGEVHGTGSILPQKLAVDARGNSYASCIFRKDIVVGQQVFSSDSESYDPLVLKWKADGEIDWAMAAKGSGYDYADGIAVNSTTTACYHTGSFRSSLSFNNHILSSEKGGFFVAKIEGIERGNPEGVSEGNLVLFPNPASGTVTLDYSATDKNLSKVTCFDVLGRKVLEQDLNSNIHPLSLVDLESGVYILSVTDIDGKKQQQKLVVQR